MELIKNTSTITSKGQITLPKFVRQALGVDTGSKLIFTLMKGQIVVNRLEEGEHHDPAIGAFLTLLEKDIRQGQHIGTIPSDLLKSMQSAAAISYPGINHLEELDIEGEVCL